MAYIMPNGVICGGAVDGSNQLGESVTCQAILTWPAGGAAAAGETVAASATAAASSRETGLVIEMAGDDAVADGALLRHLLRAARHGMRAARMEVAAARRVEGARHLAGQDHIVAPLVGMVRQR